jgi:hypothetical protein
MLPFTFLILLLIFFTGGISNAANTQRQRTTSSSPPSILNSNSLPLSSSENSNNNIATKLINSPIDIATFEQLIFEMDNTEQCNKTLSGPLIHGLVNDSFKNGQLDKNVEYILESINNAENIEPQKYPFHLRLSATPPISPPRGPKEAVFGLQLICPENHQITLHSKHTEHSDAYWTPIAVYYSLKTKKYIVIRLPTIDIDVCPLTDCLDSQCTWTIHGRTKVWARSCCSGSTQFCRDEWSLFHKVIYGICGMFAVISTGMVPMVLRERRRQQQESRGWALMEIFFIGAAILYLIPLLDWIDSHDNSCIVALWMRQIGFTLFYGSIILKIYRNLQEYRVRKAHHVIVREQDMLRYLGILIVISIVGLLGWTFGSYNDKQLWKDKWPQCSMDLWSLMWAGFEMIVLVLGMRFCYKARSSHWTERNQFTLAVCFEALVTLIATVVRYSYRENGSRDIQLLISFCQIFIAVTANILIIITPKFVTVGSESNRRTLTMSGAGNSGRAHPSLAKLRDNLINGTIDFAEVPIIDMNPEDIRAELKRVYTQLRMYKLKNLYQDNPHISKRKGGKKTSDKPKNRRISIPPTSSSPKIRRVDEEDEKSDLTVDSAPHNIYLSTNKIQLQLESADQSVRV